MSALDSSQLMQFDRRTMTLITFRIQLFLLIICCLALSTRADPRRICELDISDATYEKILQSDTFDVNWCTHLLIDKASVNTRSELVFTNKNHAEIFNKLSKWKEDNSALRIYISLTVSYQLFELHASLPVKTKTLVQNIISLKQKYDFNGINLKLTNSHEISNSSFTFFVNLKKAFIKSAQDIQLSLDLPRDFSNYNDEDFKLGAFSYYTGFFILRSYDFYTDHWFFTSFNSPLYKGGWYNRNSLHNLVNELVKNKVERARIVISLPVHAVRFRIFWITHGPGAISMRGKVISRGSLCDWFNKEKAMHHMFDDKTYEPYSYIYNQWVTYENEKSITLKLAYHFEQELGGTLIHNINLDNQENERMGNCSSSFSVHKIVNEIMTKVQSKMGKRNDQKMSMLNILQLLEKN